MKKYILAFSPLLLLCGCTNYFIDIQRTENFKDTRKDIKKVICISPDVAFYTDGDFDNIDYERTMAFENYFLEKLKKYGKVSNFEFVVEHPLISENLTADFYNYLIPLKNDILQAALVRENPLNEIHSRSDKKVSRLVFVAPSNIAPQFSALSKTFGTPYFNWYGVFTSKHRSIFINLIVDVETSQVLYHEIKGIDRRINKSNLPPLVYDSFKMIK